LHGQWIPQKILSQVSQASHCLDRR
jgi:hypothetical protein